MLNLQYLYNTNTVTVWYIVSTAEILPSWTFTWMNEFLYKMFSNQQIYVQVRTYYLPLFDAMTDNTSNGQKRKTTTTKKTNNNKQRMSEKLQF